MDSVKISLLMFGLLLVIATQSGSALKCYVCNSGKDYNGKQCESDTLDEALLFECTEKYPKMSNFTMCRKMYQVVKGEGRTVRDCAVNGNDKCVTRTGTKEVKIDYCECFGEGCNAAYGVYNSVVTFTVIISSLFSYMIFKS